MIQIFKNINISRFIILRKAFLIILNEFFLNLITDSINHYLIVYEK